MDVEVAPRTRPLDGSLRADIVVIGSGIAGLSAAYELGSAGRNVAVLDRGPIGMGMTSRTTAHLSAISDDAFSSLIDLRGEDQARDFYISHRAAIDRIAQIQDANAIACDFRRIPGILFPADKSGRNELDSEFAAAQRLHIPVRWQDGLSLAGCEHLPCLVYDSQATFHPLKYLRGLADAIRRLGGRLFSGTTVVKIEDRENGARVTTSDGHVIDCAAAIIATNSPIHDRVAIHTKQAPYRTYAMAFEISPDALADALYWDTAEPYHYVRLQSGDDGCYLIVGGEDHKTGSADDAPARFATLEAWMRQRVPSLGRETHRWSGQVMEPIDHSGFIGRNPGDRNIYVATGDSGQGMTHGVVASLVISAMIEGRAVNWSGLYEPSRKTAGAIGTYVSENATAIKNFAEYIAPGELHSLDALKPGQGAIVRDGLRKIAAFRDESGALYTHSAACTHVGCHIHWNSFEQCWDCPCHGSHFAPDGTALNAPAVAPLSSVEVAHQPKKQRAG
jgi:glycine/D-amino acid oxidase-like deaminating enzyme/nitrite reductase/ring-hydroxylating ferredoxin subunit